MFEFDCQGRTTREINSAVRQQIASGTRELKLANPEARHNLAVAITQPVRIVIDGSVGYYCGGLGDGPTIEILGSAGWGTAESMMNGTVVIDGDSGSGLAASIRGGTVVVRGNAAARAGVSLKGGTLIVGGNVGYMAGFMAQKGTMIICGDAAEALADSMYAAAVFVAGQIADLGNDAVIESPTDEDMHFITGELNRFGMPVPPAFRKVVSGRKLWNFDTREIGVWKAAL